MIAAKLATIRQGERTDLASIEARSQPQAGALLNVSRRVVQRASAPTASTVRSQVEPARRPL